MDVIIGPLSQVYPIESLFFSIGEDGWRVSFILYERAYSITCNDMPCAYGDWASAECPPYNPSLVIVASGVSTMTCKADTVLSKFKETIQAVKKETLDEVYKLILEARFHRMHACPIRDKLIDDGHLTEDEWPEILQLTNGERVPSNEAIKWDTPETDQELLDRAIQVRKVAYDLEMRRLEYSKVIESLLKPYSAGWFFKVGYKLRQSVATSHNYHCQESPLYYDTWKEFKEAWARRWNPLSVPEYASTPDFEQEYVKRKPYLDKMGEDLETKLQAELANYRKLDK